MISRQLCDVETVDDFRRYYAGSFLGFTTRNSPLRPVRIGAVDGDVIHIQEYSKEGPTPEGDRVLNWRDAQNTLSFGLPRFGMREVRNTCVYAYVSPHRNTARGYQANQITLMDFNSWYSRSKVGIIQGNHPELICETFNPTFTTPRLGIARLEEGSKIGVAVNFNVGLFTKPDCPNPLIAYRRHVAGHVDGERAVVFNHFSSVAPLIESALERRVTLV
jgi:hypothetical protein